MQQLCAVFDVIHLNILTAVIVSHQSRPTALAVIRHHKLISYTSSEL